jgi:hypothetical protein
MVAVEKWRPLIKGMARTAREQSLARPGRGRQAPRRTPENDGIRGPLLGGGFCLLTKMLDTITYQRMAILEVASWRYHTYILNSASFYGGIDRMVLRQWSF